MGDTEPKRVNVEEVKQAVKEMEPQNKNKNKNKNKNRDIPIFSIAGLLGTTGALIRFTREKQEELGLGVTSIGVGISAGEIGHRIFHIPEPKTWEEVMSQKVLPHHDTIGALGLVSTGLLDVTENIGDTVSSILYGFFGGLIIHHWITEGSSWIPGKEPILPVEKR